MARSLVDIVASLDPKHRLAQRQQLVYEQVENAKLQMQSQHQQQQNYINQQRLQIEQAKLEQNERHQREIIAGTIEREYIAGDNARALSRQEFFQNELNENTKLIHSFFGDLFSRRQDWQNKISDTRKALYEVEADTIRQKALAKQKHEQDMQKMAFEHQIRTRESQQQHYQSAEFEQLQSQLRQSETRLANQQKLEAMVLEYNLRVLMNVCDSNLQDWRVTYDGLNEILMKVIERILGLGDEQVSERDIERYVDEAMRQAYR